MSEIWYDNKDPMPDETLSPQSYAALLDNIKERIQSARVRAALAVNRELVLLYWGVVTCDP